MARVSIAFNILQNQSGESSQTQKRQTKKMDCIMSIFSLTVKKIYQQSIHPSISLELSIKTWNIQLDTDSNNYRINSLQQHIFFFLVCFYLFLFWIPNGHVNFPNSPDCILNNFSCRLFNNMFTFLQLVHRISGGWT